ncbi:FAD-dependent oxidoreductase [Aquimarina sp. M1]
MFPHQNNGHDEYQRGYFDHKFFIGGAETSDQYAGYMEGAVHSAHSIYQELLK